MAILSYLTNADGKSAFDSARHQWGPFLSPPSFTLPTRKLRVTHAAAVTPLSLTPSIMTFHIVVVVVVVASRCGSFRLPFPRALQLQAALRSAVACGVVPVAAAAVIWGWSREWGEATRASICKGSLLRYQVD